MSETCTTTPSVASSAAAKLQAAAEEQRLCAGILKTGFAVKKAADIARNVSNNGMTAAMSKFIGSGAIKAPYLIMVAQAQTAAIDFCATELGLSQFTKTALNDSATASQCFDRRDPAQVKIPINSSCETMLDQAGIKLDSYMQKLKASAAEQEKENPNIKFVVGDPKIQLRLLSRLGSEADKKVNFHGQYEVEIPVTILTRNPHDPNKWIELQGESQTGVENSNITLRSNVVDFAVTCPEVYRRVKNNLGV